MVDIIQRIVYFADLFIFILIKITMAKDFLNFTFKLIVFIYFSFFKKIKKKSNFCLFDQ